MTGEWQLSFFFFWFLLKFSYFLFEQVMDSETFVSIALGNEEKCLFQATLKQYNCIHLFNVLASPQDWGIFSFCLV